MRPLTLLSLAGLLLVTMPSASAQDDAPEPVIYMTQHKIHQARVDSLMTLTAELDMPWHNFIAENVEGYRRYWMRHDTGNEYNFMIATIYPSWDMVDSVPEDELFPQFASSMDMAPEALDAKYRPGFTWAYEGSQHMDQIWRFIASTGESQTQETLGDAVIYMTQHKIKQARMDSLASLTSEYEMPWHSFVAENVPGYERHWMRHDTGNEYNFMVVTTYPSWDMVDSMPYDELWPQYLVAQGMTQEDADEMGLEEAFGWAYEGSQHMDQIWRPVVPEAMEEN